MSKEKSTTTIEQPEKKEEVFEYEVLEDRKKRKTLKRRVEKLIKKVQKEETDFVVFVDKSARPFSWLFRDMWKDVVGDAKQPEIRFVNIGYSGEHEHEIREKRLETDSHKINEDVVKKDVKELKEKFKNQFGDKSVLIIDDVICNGTTLKTAELEFNRAFPDTKTETESLFTLDTEENVPWLHKTGYSGVLELDDKVFSRAITRKNLKEIQDRINEEIDGNLPALLHGREFGVGMDYLEDDSKELREEIKKAVSDPDVPNRVKNFLSEIEKKLVSVEIPIPKNETIEEQREYFKNLWNAYNKMWQFYEAQYYKDAIDPKDVPSKIKRISSHLQSTLYRLFSEVPGEHMFDKKNLNSLFEDAHTFENYDELRRKAKQLRDEMKQLAKEDI